MLHRQDDVPMNVPLYARLEAYGDAEQVLHPAGEVQAEEHRFEAFDGQRLPQDFPGRVHYPRERPALAEVEVTLRRVVVLQPRDDGLNCPEARAGQKLPEVPRDRRARGGGQAPWRWPSAAWPYGSRRRCNGSFGALR